MGSISAFALAILHWDGEWKLMFREPNCRCFPYLNVREHQKAHTAVMLCIRPLRRVKESYFQLISS